MANPLLTKKPRKETTVRRVEAYLGPDMEIKPETLDEYEKTGLYVIQPKVDGMWCCDTVGNPPEGRPNVLKSRDARTPEITGENAGDFRSLDMTAAVQECSILVGELEAASQWAAQQARERGFRRIHLFDVVQIGRVNDLRNLNTLERYVALTHIHKKLVILGLGDRFLLVPMFTDKFRARYDQWIKEGYEGCVIKLKNSLYQTSRSDGKTNEWLRCKKHVTEDYVLVGIGQTPGGKFKAPSPIGIWGLYIGGVLKPVMRGNCPPEYYDPQFFGKLVCEFRGWEKFESGSIRHAQFVRVREDKPPEQCVLRVNDGSTAFPVIPETEDASAKF